MPVRHLRWGHTCLWPCWARTNPKPHNTHTGGSDWSVHLCNQVGVRQKLFDGPPGILLDLYLPQEEIILERGQQPRLNRWKPAGENQRLLKPQDNICNSTVRGRGLRRGEAIKKSFDVVMHECAEASSGSCRGCWFSSCCRNENTDGLWCYSGLGSEN